MKYSARNPVRRLGSNYWFHIFPFGRILDLFRANSPSSTLLLTMPTTNIGNISSINARPRRRRCRFRRRRRRRRSYDSSSSSSDASTVDSGGILRQYDTYSSDTISQCNSHDDRPDSNRVPATGFSHSQQQQEQELPEADQSLYIALDCEMVGVGPDGLRSMLASVTLID